MGFCLTIVSSSLRAGQFDYAFWFRAVMSKCRLIVALIPSLLLFCVGCEGGGSPFEYVPVSGTLTYEDGTPLPSQGIALRFKALETQTTESMQPRPAQAGVDASGKFEAATSYKFGDGLVPGRHRVALLYATNDKGELLVPKEYTSISKSPLIVDTANLPFEIKVPRP